MSITKYFLTNAQSFCKHHPRLTDFTLGSIDGTRDLVFSAAVLGVCIGVGAGIGAGLFGATESAMRLVTKVSSEEFHNVIMTGGIAGGLIGWMASYTVGAMIEHELNVNSKHKRQQEPESESSDMHLIGYLSPYAAIALFGIGSIAHEITKPSASIQPAHSINVVSNEYQRPAEYLTSWLRKNNLTVVP